MEDSTTLSSAAAVPSAPAVAAFSTKAPEPVASLRQVSQHYGNSVALDGIDLDIPAQRMIGLIGPDGVGKSTLLGIVAGVRKMQQGQARVLEGNIDDARF